MKENRLTPLSQLCAGDKAMILALVGGRKFQHRISSMGLSVGGLIEVLHHESGRSGKGPVVVRVGETRLMLGEAMAENVMVKVRTSVT